VSGKNGTGKTSTCKNGTGNNGKLSKNGTFSLGLNIRVGG